MKFDFKEKNKWKFNLLWYILFSNSLQKGKLVIKIVFENFDMYFCLINYLIVESELHLVHCIVPV